MTSTKTFASKLTVAFVAAAMMVSAFAPAAQAQTTEDLQQMINDLLAQVAQLQAQSGQGATEVASGVCPYTWTRDLTMGSEGADVMKLQQFLNADPDTRVAASGAGSVGMETMYYGPATAAAVSKMQVKYRAQVLSPANLVNPTGYFGPSSRSAANGLCVAAPVVDDSSDDEATEDEDGMEDEDDDMDMTLRGEASLDNFELDDGESTLEEGDEDVEIGEITLEFTDGDAEISRIDVTLSSVSAEDPWDVFESISLWVDGDKIAEENADDEDDYLDENAGELRFSNLDLVAMEDEEFEIVIGATLQNNLDNDAFEDWDLEVTSMRFFDADGVATTEDSFDGISTDVATFEIQEAGTDEELNISLASSNPDSTDIIVDTDSDTDGVTIMVADIEAEDNDIELNTVVVRVETSATTTAIVDDIRVVIDGQSFDAEAITGSGLAGGDSQADGTLAVWYLFDIDGDVIIDEDDEVEMEVVVDFNDTDDGARYANGATIQATVTSVETAEWDAEGADDLDPATQISGSAVGDDHVLVAEGILVPVDGFSSDEITLGQNDDIGEFTLEFEVTAVEGDFYIANAAALASTSPTTGVAFTVSGGTATITASLDSSADEDTADVFTVREGETETFSLVVTVDPAAAGTFRVGLTGVNFTENANGTDDANAIYEVTPVTDFRTAQKAINA